MPRAFWSAVWARNPRRALRRGTATSQPGMAADGSESRLKLFGWTVGILLILGVLLGAWVLTLAGRPGPGCDGRVVIIRGPNGEPLECICQAGVLAACFNPGP